MKAAVEAVRPGLTESQIARKPSMPCVRPVQTISGGPMYHPVPAPVLPTAFRRLRRLREGDLVMIDLHPIVNGYSSDIGRTVCVGKATSEQQTAYDVYLNALQSAIAKVRQGVSITELEDTMHNVMKDAGHGAHIFGPPIHGVGINFEEAPLPPGHAFFHGEKAPLPLTTNVVIALGNCGIYTGPWGVRR